MKNYRLNYNIKREENIVREMKVYKFWAISEVVSLKELEKWKKNYQVFQTQPQRFFRQVFAADVRKRDKIKFPFTKIELDEVYQSSHHKNCKIDVWRRCFAGQSNLRRFSLFFPSRNPIYLFFFLLGGIVRENYTNGLFKL